MPLRVGLVGAGEIARVHLQALSGLETVRVVGIHDQDRERARTRAAEHGLERVYDGWAELLADREVDCVAVLLPHDLHERFAVEALAAGKHVVCEKPMGQNVAECDRMLAAADAAGRKLFPVHNRVYSHAVEKMAEIVRDGLIGEVLLAQTNGFEGPKTVGVRPWLATRRGGGGVLMAQAVHPAYVLRWLIGDVARVACMFRDRKVVDMTNEDTAIATLKFESGALAEMTATFGIAHGPFDHAIFLHGTDGYVQLGAQRERPGQRFALRVISPRMFGDADLHDVEVQQGDLSADAFRRMWQDYAGGMLDDAPTRVSGLDGKRAVEIIQAAYRSQETGHVVDLPLDD